ncbi:MAG TPA: T9SS type A sorting domain-containing protein [Edaphocola sp.]|nr:T9SS type A sorting domain-containing protein [Edaphocola sp.]
MNYMFRYLFFTIYFAFIGFLAFGQEHETALFENGILQKYHRPQSMLSTKTILNLPFFEDFNQNDYYPNKSKFQDSLAFINKTLGKNNVSLGVATLDAFNAKGFPYSPTNPYVTVNGDSLTSQFIDLSSFQPNDSIYLSFLYQGAGNGYTPPTGDSLMLFFQRSGGTWMRVWSSEGLAMDHFSAVILPIKDTTFLYSDFRFRFVNKTTYGVGNSQWNLDYIKLDANRNYQDTINNDIAFTYWGDGDLNKSIIDEYTSMPYTHFNANRSRYLKNRISATLRNNWYVPQSPTASLDVTHVEANNTVNISLGSIYFQASDDQSAEFIVPNSVIDSFHSDPMTIKFKAFINTGTIGDFTLENDTISHTQVFDNYFAYDDGSAETAYFITSYQGAPSYVAQEYNLEIPDTLRAVQIYFPRQVPSSNYKMFYLQIYKNIDATGTPDSLVYQEEDLYPSYEDRQNGFVTYNFTDDVILPAGTFYVALMFPAGGASDSLYIGLDKNKKGANFRYFKTTEHWEPSLLDGALMIRPIVGKALPVNIKPQKNNLDVKLYPNPVSNIVHIEIPEGEKAYYKIFSIDGKEIQSATYIQKEIDLNHFTPGTYFITIFIEGKGTVVKKIIKK